MSLQQINKAQEPEEVFFFFLNLLVNNLSDSIVADKLASSKKFTDMIPQTRIFREAGVYKDIIDTEFKDICLNKDKAYQFILFQFSANFLSSDPFLPKISLFSDFST